MLPPLFTRCAIGQRLAIILAIAVVILPDAALAQTPLTKATVTSFRNQVKLLPRNQPARSAQVSDQVKPGDGLATARSARADLRFNDGSLARIGQQVVFRFTSGARNFDLSNGTLLLLIPPGQGQTRVSTPNAVTGIQGSALFIRYDPATAVTTVGSLTDSGIQVWNRDQTESRILKAGQLLVVAQGPLPQPVSFDLATFYQTSALAGDLHLNDAKFSDGDTALGQVRSETVAGVAAQTLAARTNLPLGWCHWPIHQRMDFLPIARPIRRCAQGPAQRCPQSFPQPFLLSCRRRRSQKSRARSSRSMLLTALMRLRGPVRGG